MQCLGPITLYRRDGSRIGKEYRTDVVPCGKCPACLKRRQAGWVFRLEQEQLHAHTSAFLTLTYDEQNLPWSAAGYPTLDKKHHQKFIKRLRKSIKTHFPDEIKDRIKYYSCGEYGTKTHRPHYHSIIYNLPESYIKHPELLTKDWQHGSTMLAICNSATIGYVTKYINKTLYTDGQHPDDDRQKEFSLMSKGLGQQYLSNARMRYYQQTLTPYIIAQNGDKKTMPRYYKDKIYSDLEKATINEKTKLYIEQNPVFLSYKHENDFMIQEHRKQQKRNILDRQQL